MAKTVLIIGGNNSGKTRTALDMVKEKPRLYVATAISCDPEMQKKILAHKKERIEWDSMVNPLLETEQLKIAFDTKIYRSLVVDCMGFFVLNALNSGIDPVHRIIEFFNMVKEAVNFSVFVSNEIGMSPIPPYSFSRRYLKELGRVNKILAQRCDETYLVIAEKALKIG